MKNHWFLVDNNGITEWTPNKDFSFKVLPLDHPKQIVQ